MIPLGNPQHNYNDNSIDIPIPLYEL